MTIRRRKRPRTSVWIIAVLLLVAGGFVLRGFLARSRQKELPAQAFFEVKRGNLLISVMEDGALRALNETVVRSSLDGFNRIIHLVPEGSLVKKGDLLVELDSSAVRTALHEQELIYQDKLFFVLQAKETLGLQKSLGESQIKEGELSVTNAQAELEKYRDGDAPLLIRTGKARIRVLEEQVRIAGERHARTEVLFENGNATKSEVEADALTLKREKLGLEQYQEDLRLIQKFDHPNRLRLLESNVQQAMQELNRLKLRLANEASQAEADLKTSQKTLEILDETLKQQQRRVANSKIVAPQDGIVVYATSSPFQDRSELGRDEGRSRFREAAARIGDMGGFQSGGGGRRGRGRGGGVGEQNNSGGSYTGGRGGGSASSGGGTVSLASSGAGSTGAGANQASTSGTSAGTATTGTGNQTSGATSGQSSTSGNSSGGSSSTGSGGSGGRSSQGSGSGGGSLSFSSFPSLRQGTFSQTTSSGQGGGNSGGGSGGSSSSGSGGGGGGMGSGGSFASIGPNLNLSGPGSGRFNSQRGLEGGGGFFDFAGSSGIIEEGSMVRQRQELIRLPDISRMVAEVKIQETRVRQIHQGMLAYVRVETLPGRRFKGTVRRVGFLPDAQASWLNPDAKVYATDVLIDDELPVLKPGVSARTEIIITNLVNVLSVPIQAVTTFDGDSVCFAKRGKKVTPVPVTTGWFNDQFIEVTSGLKEGDRVLLAPISDDDIFGTGSAPGETNEAPVE